MVLWSGSALRHADGWVARPANGARGQGSDARRAFRTACAAGGCNGSSGTALLALVPAWHVQLIAAANRTQRRTQPPARGAAPFENAERAQRRTRAPPVSSRRLATSCSYCSSSTTSKTASSCFTSYAAARFAPVPSLAALRSASTPASLAVRLCTFLRDRSILCAATDEPLLIWRQVYSELTASHVSSNIQCVIPCECRALDPRPAFKYALSSAELRVSVGVCKPP